MMTPATTMAGVLAQLQIASALVDLSLLEARAALDEAEEANLVDPLVH